MPLLTSHYCTFLAVLCGLGVHLVPGSQRWFNEFPRRLFALNKTTITSLGISGSRNTPIRDETRLALSILSNREKELSFGPILFDKFEDFLGIISAFNNLQSLSHSKSPTHRKLCRLQAVFATSNYLRPR
jgi:hypothetical protein